MSLTLSAHCQAIAPSPTLAIDARAKEMKSQGLDVIGFGAGEPDFDTPAHICEAAATAIARGMTRYTPVAGTPSLRRAICDKLARDNDLHYTPEQIIVSNGAKHSLFIAFQALLNPGDEVLIPTPWWVSYPEIVRMAGGVPVQVPTTEAQGFVADAATLAPYVTPRTKALILNSPNNPNGSVWSRAQLADIAALAVARGFYVVSDEIYEKLIYDGETHVSIASLGAEIAAQTLVINGVSKAFAMTGWRIGYTAGPKPVIQAMTNYQSHSASNPNSIAQHAAIAALEGGDETVRAMVSAFAERRVVLVQGLNAIEGISCGMPKGAFYAMMNIQGVLGRCHQGRTLATALDFADALLAAQKVAVVPGEGFDAPHYCRLSYALSTEALREGIARIAAFVGELTLD